MYFLNKVLCSQVGQSVTARGIEEFVKVKLFADHDGKLQAVKEAVTTDAFNPEEDLSGPASCTALHCRSDGMELIGRFVQFFDSFKSVPSSYPTLSLEQPPAIFGALMIAGYYDWHIQATHPDSHAQITS